MKRITFSLLAVMVFLGCILTSIAIYGSYRDSTLRHDILKVKVDMTENEVIAILGTPTNIAISDIPGTYWHYRTDYLYQIVDDNPDSVGYLVLEMGSNGKVVKVLDLR
jgi:outer membrane protein assembly factor BamE (lipoprotein component of BamABCDE complex)